MSSGNETKVVYNAFNDGTGTGQSIDTGGAPVNSGGPAIDSSGTVDRNSLVSFFGQDTAAAQPSVAGQPTAQNPAQEGGGLDQNAINTLEQSLATQANQPAAQAPAQQQTVPIETLNTLIAMIQSGAINPAFLGGQPYSFNQQAPATQQQIEQPAVQMPSLDNINIEPPQLDEDTLQRLEELSYQSPMAAMQEYFRLALPSIMGPVQKAMQPLYESYATQNTYNSWYQAASDFSQLKNPTGQPLYPEFDNLRNEMADIINAMPETMWGDPMKALDLAYNAAVGRKNSMVQVPTTDELLTQPETLQKILSNPDLTNAVVQARLQQIKTSQQNIPTLSGTTQAGGGGVPIIPPIQINTMEDANKAVKAHFGL